MILIYSSDNYLKMLSTKNIVKSNCIEKMKNAFRDTGGRWNSTIEDILTIQWLVLDALTVLVTWNLCIWNLSILVVWTCVHILTSLS